MKSSSRKAAVASFPLRLMPSVRLTAEAFSEKQEVSLNPFIQEAVEEKVKHLQHEEWMRGRREPTAESIEEALELLARSGTEAPEPGDELAEGYIPFRIREH